MPTQANTSYTAPSHLADGQSCDQCGAPALRVHALPFCAEHDQSTLAATSKAAQLRESIIDACRDHWDHPSYDGQEAIVEAATLAMEYGDEDWDTYGCLSPLADAAMLFANRGRLSGLHALGVTLD